jgi:hypothetical protein
LKFLFRSAGAGYSKNRFDALTNLDEDHQSTLVSIVILAPWPIECEVGNFNMVLSSENK